MRGFPEDLTQIGLAWGDSWLKILENQGIVRRAQPLTWKIPSPRKYRGEGRDSSRFKRGPPISGCSNRGYPAVATIMTCHLTMRSSPPTSA